MVSSGQKVTEVPVVFDLPTSVIFLVVLPRANSISTILPSRLTCATSFFESALTTEMPTPCRPPDTL